MKVQTRKATMTNRERIEALLKREKPDRVPFAGGGGGFSSLYSGYSLADMYTRTPKMAYEVERKAAHDFDWVFTPTFAAYSGSSAFGAEIKLPTSQYSQATYVVKYPVETPEEAMALNPPDVKATITPDVMEFYKISSQDKDNNKPFNLSFNTGGVLGTVANIIGPDKLCKWMLKEPEVIHHLLRLAIDRQIKITQYYRDTLGVDGLLPTCGSAHASNQLISPKHFEEFVLPYCKELHEKVLVMGFKYFLCHPCGEQNLNLPYYQQVPIGDPGIHWIGNEIDLETMAKYFPSDIIAGNLNTTTIQVGTPDEVYEATRRVIEKGKSLANGFMLRPACGLPPRAPAENVMAITRAVNDFGWYD